MSISAIILMASVWSAIFSLLAFCFYKVFSKKN